MESDYLINRRNIMLGLKEKPVKEKPKPISIHSVKRKAEEKLYSKKKKEYLTTRIRCEVKGCNKVSEDIHHKKGRVGKLLFNEKYFLAVCRDCHTNIENNPDWAKENKYSLSRVAVAEYDKEVKAIIIT